MFLFTFMTFIVLKDIYLLKLKFLKREVKPLFYFFFACFTLKVKIYFKKLKFEKTNISLKLHSISAVNFSLVFNRKIYNCFLL